MTERVSEFTYLGSDVSENGETEEDIIARIWKGQMMFTMLMPVWKANAIRLRTKVKIFNNAMFSLSLYTVQKHGDQRRH